MDDNEQQSHILYAMHILEGAKNELTRSTRYALAAPPGARGGYIGVSLILLGFAAPLFAGTILRIDPVVSVSLIISGACLVGLGMAIDAFDRAKVLASFSSRTDDQIQEALGQLHNALRD